MESVGEIGDKSTATTAQRDPDRSCVTLQVCEVVA